MPIQYELQAKSVIAVQLCEKSVIVATCSNSLYLALHCFSSDIPNSSHVQGYQSEIIVPYCFIWVE